jgi:hypothetical protein
LNKRGAGDQRGTADNGGQTIAEKVNFTGVRIGRFHDEFPILEDNAAGSTVRDHFFRLCHGASETVSGYLHLSP